MDTLDQVDMVTRLDLTNPHLSPAERRAAADFHRADSGGCCMCAECKRVCPRGLPVNDLMRFRMYHEEYGWPEHARAEYASLGVDFRQTVASCGDCTACADVCPAGLAGRDTIRRVAEMLA